MARKTDRLIVAAQEMRSLVYHDAARAARELGPLINYMDSDLVPEADIVVHVREVRRVPPGFKSHVEPHTHEVSEFFGIIGDLTMEFILNGERHEVSGPHGIFVPPGVSHTLRPLRGKGYLLVVVRKGVYE